MEEFIVCRDTDPRKWGTMRELAHNTAVKQFSKENYGNTIKKIITSGMH
jgi:hypothetical protein